MQQNAWGSRAESLRCIAKDSLPFATGSSLGVATLYAIRPGGCVAQFRHRSARWCRGLSNAVQFVAREQSRFFDEFLRGARSGRAQIGYLPIGKRLYGL